MTADAPSSLIFIHLINKKQEKPGEDEKTACLLVARMAWLLWCDTTKRKIGSSPLRWQHRASSHVAERFVETHWCDKHHLNTACIKQLTPFLLSGEDDW